MAIITTLFSLNTYLITDFECIYQFACIIGVFVGANVESWAKSQGEGFKGGEIRAKS